jgi:hypothetical protein
VERAVKAESLPIRVDEFVVRHLSEAAEAKGIGASKLARMWILERLAGEAPPSFGPWVGRSVSEPS